LQSARSFDRPSAAYTYNYKLIIKAIYNENPHTLNTLFVNWKILWYIRQIRLNEFEFNLEYVIKEAENAN
jgi:hypothetical protein